MTRPRKDGDEPNEDEGMSVADLLKEMQDEVDEPRAPAPSPAPDEAPRPQPIYTLPAEEYRAREIARIKAEAATLHSDKTVPGGRYLTADGKLVDCEGRPLEK